MEMTARWLKRAIHPLARYMDAVGVSLVLLIVGTITLDILLRWFLNTPIPGSLEITELTLPLVIFLAVAYTAVEKRHVAIDILYTKMPMPWQKVCGVFTNLLSLSVLAVITWRLFDRALYALRHMEQGDVIGIPYWPTMILSSVGLGVLSLVIFTDLLWSMVDARRVLRRFLPVMAGVCVAAVIFALLPWLLEQLPWRMSHLQTGILFVAMMIFLMVLKMPIAFSMAFVGMEGLWVLKGLSKTLPLMALGPWVTASHWSYSVIPTFVLMGMFAFHSGMSRDLYETAYRWFGHLPGGLAVATVAACGGFAAICGCSTATAATMGTIAMPEMRRFRYKPTLSAGAVAAGGTLGILIPPSLGFMVYGVITEVAIGKLFIAGILPGIILAILFMLSVSIRCRIHDDLGPKGAPSSMRERLASLRNTWPMLVLFIGVMGGLYFGIFNPTEAGSIGAFGALFIGVVQRRLTRKRIMDALLEAGRLSAMIFMILCSVKILTYFIALTKIPFALSELILSFEVSRYAALFLILLLYVILGMLMNIIPMIMLTLPIIFPVVMELGFDPIWFGVIMVIMMEMGQITPPVGINTFVVSGVAQDVPMGKIFRGIMPFWLIQVVVLVLLILFPQIATYLPALMR